MPAIWAIDELIISLSYHSWLRFDESHHVELRWFTATGTIYGLAQDAVGSLAAALKLIGGEFYRLAAMLALAFGDHIFMIWFAAEFCQ